MKYQSVLAMMFCRKALLKKIEEIHQQVVSSLMASLTMAGIERDATVIDILCLPDSNGIPSPIPATHQAVKEWMLGGLPIKLNYFGTYSMLQCKVLEKNREFAAVLKAAGHDLTEAGPSAHDLNEMGLLAARPSACLAIKYAWLCWRYDDRESPHYTHFLGNPACTSPVREFIHKHFGLTNPSQPQTNEITFAIAHELGMDPLYVNTAMWLIENPQ